MAFGQAEDLLFEKYKDESVVGPWHMRPNEWLDVTAEKYKPRYGCGMCQTKVPCESGLPIASIQ